MNDMTVNDSTAADIIAACEAKLAAEEIGGLSHWLKQLNWPERNVLNKYIEQYSEQRLASLTQVQHTMVLLISYGSQSILDIKEIGFNLPHLSDAEIEEIIAFYGLTQPDQRYKEIKARIASPESFMTAIPYSIIKYLYEIDKVPFDRQIFAACLIRFNVWHGSSFTKTLSSEACDQVDRLFPKDAFSLDILLAVFEMELGVNSAFYLQHELNIGAVIIKLVNDGHLERSKIQQKLFDAFNNPTLKQSTQTWVKNVYEGLDYNVSENIACQSQIIELLHNDVNLVANFAIKLIKSMAVHSDFDWSLLISSLEGVVYRTSFNGGLKAVLKLLYKKFSPKSELTVQNIDLDLLAQTCLALAPVFIQEDSAVQAEAVKIFALWPKSTDESQDDSATKAKHQAQSQASIVDALAPFVSTMHSDSKAALSHLLATEELAGPMPNERYQQSIYTPDSIQSLTPLKYIDNESDFIFLCTKVLKSLDALDYELFLEALLRYHSIKDSQPQALGSALKMAKKVAYEPYYNITAKQGIHHILIAKLICLWLDPNAKTALTNDSQLTGQRIGFKDFCVGSSSSHAYAQKETAAYIALFGRLDLIAQTIQTGNNIVLLSTPTHSNGAIDVDVFFQRLSYYEAHDIAFNEADFNMALCRLNRWSPYQAPQDYDAEHRDILAYLLSDQAEFNVNKIKTLESSWLTAFIIKNPNLSTEVLELFSSKKTNWWTAEDKNVFIFSRRYSDDSQYSWAQLKFDIDHFDDEYYNRSSANFAINHFSYYLLNYATIIADASHWYLKDGYCLEPLYLSLILANYNYLTQLESVEQKSVMATLLESTKQLKPLGKNGMMFLCLGLTASDKAVRQASLDWLLLLIEHRYLDLALFSSYLSQIISNEYHPIPLKRLLETFEQLQQLGGVYIDILYVVLQDLLRHVNPDNLPSGFKAILHFYYEALIASQAPIAPDVQSNLEAMRKVASVKQPANKILNLQLI